jgi:hypothetical protein
MSKEGPQFGPSFFVKNLLRQDCSNSYIQPDETPVDVQTREGRGKNRQAYLWQYSRPGGSVVFDFRLGRRTSLKPMDTRVLDSSLILLEYRLAHSTVTV